ncbi:hypothetical protein [Bartonella sp. A05]|uniref:hypothetical protein n=1 Tax=Bartonella sp. A05 TaxID=2967261 RepID=UPI0022A9CC14|nr:hypothetical protein [Bartonella sp. A05]MCZ2203701.1 hypothetical protein [Bartonella sp. A05]
MMEAADCAVCNGLYAGKIGFAKEAQDLCVQYKAADCAMRNRLCAVRIMYGKVLE